MAYRARMPIFWEVNAMEWFKALGWFGASYLLFGYAVKEHLNPAGTPDWVYSAELIAYPVMVFGLAWWRACAEAAREHRAELRQEVVDSYAELGRQARELRE